MEIGLEYEIDHLFKVVMGEDEAQKLASSTGLKIFPKTVHVNQGTSGIFHMFEKSYFEFIWLHNMQEARNNILRFDLKIEAVKKGGSPFGVALRLLKGEPDQMKFVKYQPEYGKYEIFILKESLQDPYLPLLFFIRHPERHSSSSWYPLNFDSKAHPYCNFESLIKIFESANIRSNHLLSAQFKGVNLIKADIESLEIKTGTFLHYLNDVTMIK